MTYKNMEKSTEKRKIKKEENSDVKQSVALKRQAANEKTEEQALPRTTFFF